MAVSDFNIIKDGKSNSIPIAKAVFENDEENHEDMLILNLTAETKEK